MVMMALIVLVDETKTMTLGAPRGRWKKVARLLAPPPSFRPKPPTATSPRGDGYAQHYPLLSGGGWVPTFAPAVGGSWLSRLTSSSSAKVLGVHTHTRAHAHTHTRLHGRLRASAASFAGLSLDCRAEPLNTLSLTMHARQTEKRS